MKHYNPELNDASYVRDLNHPDNLAAGTFDVMMVDLSGDTDRVHLAGIDPAVLRTTRNAPTVNIRAKFNNSRTNATTVGVVGSKRYVFNNGNMPVQLADGSGNPQPSDFVSTNHYGSVRVQDPNHGFIWANVNNVTQNGMQFGNPKFKMHYGSNAWYRESDGVQVSPTVGNWNWYLLHLRPLVVNGNLRFPASQTLEINGYGQIIV